jgi:transposase
VPEHAERLQRLEPARPALVPTWRFAPVGAARQARRGVQLTVAVTRVAERGDWTRVDHPRPLLRDRGLTPSAYARGERRRQGSLTTAGNTPARRARIAGAWA